MKRLFFACVPVLACAIPACVDEGVSPTPQIADGIFGDELGDPLPSATDEQLATFQKGHEVALRRFGPKEGLGPTFNVTFCGACHEKPVTGGAGARYRNFLLVRQELGDGSQTNTGVNGVQDQYKVGDVPYDALDEQTNRVAQRHPIPFFGVGLLAEITGEEILKRADPDDADGDGVSGRANYDRGFVGRFGRKSQTVSIEGFIRGPLFNHAGITTDPLSNERKNQLPVPSGVAQTAGQAKQAQASAPDEPTVDDDGVADPEMSEDDLFNVVSFAMLMAPPRPDDLNDQTKHGLSLFNQAGCDKCHAPTLTGPRGLIPAYTDLLLHDMGEEMADGIRMAEAGGAEFRTQPLWGIAAVGPYLHDGRADTLDLAVRYHGGEGKASRDAYAAMSDSDRADLVAFLTSLGGASQRSEGLLPPDAEVPGVGQNGGPDVALSGDDLARFERGRAVFDLDRPITGGLGPKFNGDSCRACHFDPVIGGAGPGDVNVIRQGVIDDAGSFSDPGMGTMLHRHMVGDGRPAVDPKANLFEARQTPSALGLGLIDQIPEAAILAGADPDDADGDGIRGIARILPDGRLGRLGWKAGVPSVAEFARDATFNELGVTLPEQQGLTFGAAKDDDDAPDPEISKADLEDMVFFLSHLGPPARTPSNPPLEAKGALVFMTVGCGKCHTPSLPTKDGFDVPLYSDLLLHDVAKEGMTGIADGPASMRQFRTSPLWGIAKTAPYMHNGAAETVEDAIALHASEGKSSVDAYQSLSADDRAALIAFLKSL